MRGGVLGRVAAAQLLLQGGGVFSQPAAELAVSAYPDAKPGMVCLTFDDGTKSCLEQQAKDVAAFIAWASEPKMEERKAFGMAAMIYLFIFAGLLYASYRKIWKNVAH